MKRVTRADVLALIAIFIALGGTSLAARPYLITSTSQISPGVRAQLKGKTGPTGKEGVEVIYNQGLPGAPGKDGAPGITPEIGAIAQALKQGDTGQQGAQGATGPRGYNAPQGGFPWEAGKTYRYEELAANGGSQWISRRGSNVGHEPKTDDGTNWTLFLKGTP